MKFPFAYITGDVVKDILSSDLPTIVGIVDQAYQAHGEERTVNPPSAFLYPGQPNTRSIALMAKLGDPFNVFGLKWIASFPANVVQGTPRASAVLILNDDKTGYPYAVLEASQINSARTAASGVLAADWLQQHQKHVDRIGFIGTGVIARTIYRFFVGNGWTLQQVYLHDLNRASAEQFRDHMQAEHQVNTTLCDRPHDVLATCQMIVLATTAGRPYIHDRSLIQHNPLLLHISLRDLAPELLLDAINIVDDIEHVMHAETSPHLAERMCGHRDFVTGTLYDLMTGRCRIAHDRPIIFSPFGLGILDLAVGKYVYDEATMQCKHGSIRNFFGFERTQ